MITDPVISGLTKQSQQLQYCVQEHFAPYEGLHWDLRLEWRGVAKSWALQKSPPEYSGVKRLAIPKVSILIDSSSKNQKNSSMMNIIFFSIMS